VNTPREIAATSSYAADPAHVSDESSLADVQRTLNSTGGETADRLIRVPAKRGGWRPRADGRESRVALDADSALVWARSRQQG
jgi:hypothetical protein